jgi:hypothetical protein
MSAFQANIDREVQSLKVLCLKAISKDPVHHIDSAKLQKAAHMLGVLQNKSFDFAQELVAYLTEAGQFVDDALPPTLFINDDTTTPRVSLSFSNGKVSVEYLMRTLDCCPQLEYLDLSGCFQTNDAIVLYIGQKCPNIQHLNLRNCRKLTDLCLQNLMGMGVLPKLTALHLGGVVNLTEGAINDFLGNGSRFSSIIDLNLSGTKVSDATLDLIGLRNKHLRSLSIAFSDVSEVAVRRLLEKIGKKLELLNISWLCTTTGCQNAPLSVDFFIDFLPRRCIALQELEVTGSKNISIPCLAQYLDTENQMTIKYPADAKSLKILRCKFVSSPKDLIDKQLGPNYPNVKFLA